MTTRQLHFVTAVAVGWLYCAASGGVLASDGSSRVQLSADASGSDGNLHTPGEAAALLKERCETGSLLFSRGDCLAVRAYTGSSYTHVAVFVSCDAGDFIYDSMNGQGVRKLTVEEYLLAQAPDELFVLHPARPFNSSERENFIVLLEAELGRPYAVGHFVTGRRCSGLHCAEYLTQSLAGIDWLKVNNPARVSPASLMKGVEENQLYRRDILLLIQQPLTPIPEPEGWCGRCWEETKTCSLHCCRQLSRWVLCR